MERSIIFTDFKEVEQILLELEKKKIELIKLTQEMKDIELISELIKYPDYATEILNSFKVFNADRIDRLRESRNWLFKVGTVPNNCAEIALLYWIVQSMPSEIHVEFITGLFGESYFHLAICIADEYKYKDNPYFLLSLSLDELVTIYSDAW